MSEDPPHDEAENPDQRLLSAAAINTFRLNGRFLAVAEKLAGTAGLTAARWQVLGAVLHDPLPVAGIARAVGITRQSVQRSADVLVEQGLAEYLPNPAHRRAKLVRPTPAGLEAVSRIDPAHRAFASRLVEEIGRHGLEDALDALIALGTALEALEDLAEP